MIRATAVVKQKVSWFACGLTFRWMAKMDGDTWNDGQGPRATMNRRDFFDPAALAESAGQVIGLLYRAFAWLEAIAYGLALTRHG
jgi:hypothetical protein